MDAAQRSAPGCLPVRRRRSSVFGAGLLVSALALAFGAALPARAAAQDAPVLVRGITVIGYGEASAPAEAASLQVIVSRNDYGPPLLPRPGTEPGEEEREAVAPVVAALVAEGIVEAEIEVVVSPVIGSFYGPGGSGIARLDLTLDQPTTERINDLLGAAQQGAAEEGLVVGQAGVGYEVADCAPLERAAREAAIADAREQAELQAELLGVALGEAVASADMPLASAAIAYFGGVVPATGSCAPPVEVPFTGSPLTVPIFDSTGEAEVEIYAQIAVTFELAGSPPA